MKKIEIAFGCEFSEARDVPVGGATHARKPELFSLEL